MNTLFNQLDKRAKELKPWRQHGAWSWIFHENSDMTYKNLQEKGKIQVNPNFQGMQRKKTYVEREIFGT